MNAMVARYDRRIGGNSAVMLATPLEAKLLRPDGESIVLVSRHVLGDP
jgi:hypothetical protein